LCFHVFFLDFVMLFFFAFFFSEFYLLQNTRIRIINSGIAIPQKNEIINRGFLSEFWSEVMPILSN
jgi:hypothetical protein